MTYTGICEGCDQRDYLRNYTNEYDKDGKLMFRCDNCWVSFYLARIRDVDGWLDGIRKLRTPDGKMSRGHVIASLDEILRPRT